MSEWIDVKDSLPEDALEHFGSEIQVLATYIIHGDRDHPYVREQIRWYNGYEWVWTDTGYTTVTHWMPMPEPAKEK